MLLHDLLFRLRTLIRRSAAENELEDELRFHLEQQAPPSRARLCDGTLQTVTRSSRICQLRNQRRCRPRTVREIPAAAGDH